MNPDDVLAVPAHVVARRIGNETVLLDLESGTYFGLDPVGARIFELIGEGRSIAAIGRALLAEYEIGEDVLMMDVERLVAELRANGLVTLR